MVLNSGYNFVKKKWTKADGLAKFRGDKNVAALKKPCTYKYIITNSNEPVA